MLKGIMCIGNKRKSHPGKGESGVQKEGIRIVRMGGGKKQLHLSQRFLYLLVNLVLNINYLYLLKLELRSCKFCLLMMLITKLS